MTTVSDEELAEMYASGQSLMAISLQIGQSHQYVKRHLNRCGIKLRPLRKGGTDHSQWIGGRLEVGNGYWRVWLQPDDPLASMRTHQGYVLEHRLIMARKIGRPLRRTETVHHINGNRADNRPENLELHQGKHGSSVAMCCLDCGSRNLGHVKLG